MSKWLDCEHCGGTVIGKRSMDPKVALYNHIRLSHPDVKIALVIPSSTLDLNLPTNTGATQ